MNPVVGLDVAKGESEAQAFLDKDKPFKKSFKIKHITEDLDTFISFLKEIERKTGVRPAVILESTGITIPRLFNVWRTVNIYIFW